MPELISTVFRCPACRAKHTFGAEHPDPLPEVCTECGEPWKGEPRWAEEPARG